MNTYQTEQLEALLMLRGSMELLENSMRRKDKGLYRQFQHYLAFRSDAERYFKTWFEGICTEKCYSGRLSACCSRDGIITFWADVVVNAYVSRPWELDRLEAAIRQPLNEDRCIYLGEMGCGWRMKPVVCEMFLCPDAEKPVFEINPEAGKQWSMLKERKKGFTWPDRPVLFEALETIYMNAGYDSSLMYIHKSPGLQRIMRSRGLHLI